MSFATELDLRNECQCYDTGRISPEAIARSLAEAHQRILDETTLTDSTPVTPLLMRAEVFLGLSILMRQEELQSRLNQNVIRLQSLKFDDPDQPERIHALRERLESEAWGLLRPWWKQHPPAAVQISGSAS